MAACCRPPAVEAQSDGISNGQLKGPGYATPLDAFNSGDVEKLLYVVAVYSGEKQRDAT
jgi:hypothetical protein